MKDGVNTMNGRTSNGITIVRNTGKSNEHKPAVSVKLLSIAVAETDEETVRMKITLGNMTIDVALTSCVRQFKIPAPASGYETSWDFGVYEVFMLEMEKRTGIRMFVFEAPKDGSKEPYVFDNTGGTFKDLQQAKKRTHGLCVQARHE